MKHPLHTSDASWAYSDRTGVEIARLDSTAREDSLASVTKGATFGIATISFYPVHTPAMTYIFEPEQGGQVLGIIEP